MKLRPSAAHIWTRCPGQPHLVERIPASARVETDPAREGTCAAWVAEMVLRDVVAHCSLMIGDVHENGWVVDEAMTGFIQDYVDLLRERYGPTVRAEQFVWLTPNIGGTPDASAVLNGHLAVDDLKYGYDIVEPWENLQLIIYAGAVARTATQPITSVTLGIYQPRAFHPLGVYRTWSPTIEELSERIAEIIEAGNEALRPDAICKAGPWCRRCDVANTCSAVAHEAYRCVSTMQQDHQRQMTTDEMVNELDFLDLAERIVKGRRDAVHAEAEARIKRGELLPGWTLESGIGQRRWKMDATTIQLVTGVDPSSDKMVTPAELERRGADKSKVALLTEQPKTAPRLKRFSSQVAASKFGEIK